LVHRAHFSVVPNTIFFLASAPLEPNTLALTRGEVSAEELLVVVLGLNRVE
jgi:hypothetical protein